MMDLFLRIFTPWDCIIMVLIPGCFIVPCGTCFFSFIIMKSWVAVPEISLDPYIKWPRSMKYLLFLFFTEILAILLMALGLYFALSPYFREYFIMTNLVNLFGAFFVSCSLTILFSFTFKIIFFAMIGRMHEIIMNNPQKEVFEWAKNTLNLYKRAQCSLNASMLLLLLFSYVNPIGKVSKQIIRSTHPTPKI